MPLGLLSPRATAGEPVGHQEDPMQPNKWIDFPVAQTVKSLPVVRETRVPSLGWETPLEKGLAIYSTVFLPGEFHGQRSLAGYSLWGCKELNLTESHTHTHTHTLQSVGSQRVEPDWVTHTHTHTDTHRQTDRQTDRHTHATVRGVAKSWTWLSDTHTHTDAPSFIEKEPTISRCLTEWHTHTHTHTDAPSFIEKEPTISRCAFCLLSSSFLWLIFFFFYHPPPICAVSFMEIGVNRVFSYTTEIIFMSTFFYSQNCAVPSFLKNNYNYLYPLPLLQLSQAF